MFAGRTDTGVHALGQVVAFDLDWAHTPEALQAALNAHLPPDVAVLSAGLARDDFHPRYDAEVRRYSYHIFCQPARHPLRERYAWRVWPGVAVEKLADAAGYLIGSHDFAAFGTPPRTGGSTVRTVFKAGWATNQTSWGETGLVFEISGNAFLYRMVRRLVYLQVEIGQGRYEPDILAQYLQNPGPDLLQGLAPANGLVLVGVGYRS